MCSKRFIGMVVKVLFGVLYIGEGASRHVCVLCASSRGFGFGKDAAQQNGCV